jgi:hypothetical protein
MKRLLIIASVLILSAKASAQGFPNTDSLRTYNIKYITSNPATAFTNLRLHTLLRGIIDHIDTARSGGGSAIGVDTLWALNDSTIRYRKNGAFKNVPLKGVYDTRRKVDTAYALNDSTIQIKINGANRNVIIPGRPRVDTLYRKSGQDSIYYTINGVEHAIKDSTGAATSGITELTGDVTAGPGSGSQAATIASNAVTTIKINNAAVTIPKLSATGTADNTTFLRGDGAWATPAGGTFDAVLTTDPDLQTSHTVNQHQKDLYFTQGRLKSDSIIIRNTESFMSTGSILGVGHSIAYRFGSSNFDSAFIGRIAAYYHKIWDNQAVVGSGVTRVVDQHNRNTGPGAHRATIVMGALNSIRSGWTNIKTYRRIVNAYKAIFTNQFALLQDSTSGPNVTKSGGGWSTYTGRADAEKFYTTSFTNVQDDSASYTFTGPAVSVVMMGTDSSGSTIYIGSNVEIKIDGVSKGVFATNNQTDGVTDPVSGFNGHRSPMAFIFDGLKDTVHTITVVNTENKYMYIDYFAPLVRAPQDAYPLVIMNEPYMASAGYAGLGSDALIDSFNRGIDSTVAAFPHQFPARIGHTNKYYTGPPGGGDGIHPDENGHRDIFRALLEDIETNDPGKLLYSNNDFYLSDGTRTRKIYDTANLHDASTTERGLVGTTAQTFAGTKTFFNDIVVNQLRVGNGTGNYASNTYVGGSTGINNSGDNGNTAIGQSALNNNTTGYFNTMVGRTAGANIFSGNSNTAIGHAALNLATGSRNVAIGLSAGANQTTGNDKLWIANSDLNNLIYGDFSAGRLIVNAGSSPTDNGVGALQVRGKLTVDAHTIASNSDSAIVLDRSTNEYKVAKINGTSVSTIYTGDGTLAGNRTVTGSNNSITFDDIFAFRINSDYNVIAKANATGIYTEAVIGAGNIYELGYTPTPGIFSKGAGLFIDSNENVGIGSNPPTTMPLYATGASLFVQGLQSNHGNYYKVSNVTTDVTASLQAYFYTIDASGGNVIITLPAASSAFGNTMGITYKFQRTDNSGNTVTIQRAGSDTINGATSFTLTTQYGVKQLQCTSTSTWAQW